MLAKVSKILHPETKTINDFIYLRIDTIEY
jgi:hypothetical protein